MNFTRLHSLLTEEEDAKGGQFYVAGHKRNTGIEVKHHGGGGAVALFKELHRKDWHRCRESYEYWAENQPHIVTPESQWHKDKRANPTKNFGPDHWGEEGDWDSVPVLYISDSHLGENYRGKGLGVALYEKVINAWAERHGKPFLFTKDACYTMGVTSSDADRVWDSLAKRYPSHGHILYIA